MAISPLSAPFCSGYKDKSELGDWEEGRGQGGLRGTTQPDTWEFT